jgi:hypothetical protein
MLAVNLAKRLLISQFLVAVKTPLKYFLALALFLPWKQKLKIFNTWAYNYNQVADRVLRPYYLKVNRMTSLGQEIYGILISLFTELGVGKGKIEPTSRILATIIDFDTAYRYRIEDLMSETSKEQMLKRPIREIRRLLKILQDRDSRPELNSKFSAIGLALAAILLIPRFRKAFKKAMGNCTFSNLQLDAADRYHVLALDGYKFLGRSIEDRWAEYVRMHNGNPPKLYKLQGGILSQ